MAVQHVNIADADRHENKHASTATNGQILKANGDGSSAFVSPSTLENVTISSTLEAVSTTSQNPSAVDTAYQVTFGAGDSNSDVTVASNGIITINTSGLYNVTFNISLGRATATGIAVLLARLLINDTPSGFVQGVKIDTSANVTPLHASLLRKFTASDTIKLQIIRDSTGANDGGVISLVSTPSGWEDSPSAAVRIQKIGGGF
jgi:hypothetical protein